MGVQKKIEADIVKLAMQMGLDTQKMIETVFNGKLMAKTK